MLLQCGRGVAGSRRRCARRSRRARCTAAPVIASRSVAWSRDLQEQRLRGGARLQCKPPHVSKHTHAPHTHTRRNHHAFVRATPPPHPHDGKPSLHPHPQLLHTSRSVADEDAAAVEADPTDSTPDPVLAPVLAVRDRKTARSTLARIATRSWCS